MEGLTVESERTVGDLVVKTYKLKGVAKNRSKIASQMVDVSSPLMDERTLMSYLDSEALTKLQAAFKDGKLVAFHIESTDLGSEDLTPVKVTSPADSPAFTSGGRRHRRSARVTKRRKGLTRRRRLHR